MRTEESIKKSVVDQLYWDDRVDASDVKIDVKGSRVTLNGTVPDYTAQQAAVVDAWVVDGVTMVNNNLSIKPSTAIELPKDDGIEEWVNNSYFWDTNIDSTEVDVDVENGFVTLEGSVDAYWKKLRAENIASDTTGVLGVTNKVAVVPTESFIDKEIAEDIVHAIDRRYDVRPDDVDVKVKNGTVTLTGKVPSWRAYSAITTIAENTAGVLDVESNLIIDY